MRIIPKKIKVKNTVWKCYSMADVIVALVVLAIIFVAITSGSYAFAVIMGLIAVVMFMPTQDGIFYSCILENIKFLFAKKVYTENASKAKERVDAIIDLKELTEFSKVSFDTNVVKGDWIMGITGITVKVSDDGQTFREVASKSVSSLQQKDADGIYPQEITFDTQKARYVEVIIRNGKLPSWHGGAGNPAYIFVDEISIE